MDSKQKHILFWLIILVVILIGYNQYNPAKPVDIVPDGSAIQSFEDCAAAGNPVMESYPRQCMAGGKTFVEEIEYVDGPCRNEDSGCTPMGPPCCPGLRPSSDAVETKDGCAVVTCGSVCLPCGNGICDDNENRCSCPEDCGKMDIPCQPEMRDADYCIAEYRPVCGFKGDGSSETYSNMCNACKNSEVDYFQEGEC